MSSSLFLCLLTVRLGLGGYEGLGDKWYRVYYFWPTTTYYVAGVNVEHLQFINDLLPTPGVLCVSEPTAIDEPTINKVLYENIPRNQEIDFRTSVYIRKDVSLWDERVNIKPHTETEAKQIIANAIEELNNLAKNKLNN